MSYIDRRYNYAGIQDMTLYGGNCGCSDCLNKGGQGRMIQNPNTSTGLWEEDEAHILPYYGEPQCNCDTCHEATEHINEIAGGNIFDELSNIMPDILGNVPIVGNILKPVTQGVLDILDPYRKNPRNVVKDTAPYGLTHYTKPKTNFSKTQQDFIKSINKPRGGAKPRKGSMGAKEKMAYLRSLKK